MLRSRIVLALTLVVALGLSPFVVKAVPPAPLVATVSVTATDPNSQALFYNWKVTDGTITGPSINTTTINWQLPNGPGVHFAYVLVKNATGGAVERRIAVITDGIGDALLSPAPVLLDAPAAALPRGEPFRSRFNSDSSVANGGQVDLTNVPVMVKNLATGETFPPQTCATLPCVVYTDLRGEYTLPDVRPGSLQVLCDFSRSKTPNLTPCDSFTTAPGRAFFSNLRGPSPNSASSQYQTDIVGSAFGTDGRPCGITSRFFAEALPASPSGLGIGEQSGTANLLDATGALLQGPVNLDAYGNFEFQYNPKAATIKAACFGLGTAVIPVSSTVAAIGGNVGKATIPGVATPVIAPGGMTATISNGKTFKGPLLPAGAGSLPSDQQFAPNRFFSYLGLDTRQGACQYYRAIGGVTGCNADGTFITPISFDDWKRSEKMSPYVAAGGTEHSASYVNRVDLNLTRRHHLVSYTGNQTAGYVCNHLGPTVARVGLDAAQPDVDAAIAQALNGNQLVACVAMDYRVHPGVNGNKPFVRFFIFGPDGSLLPSINLDFEAEKYVPGVCVACHGGDHYMGPYPSDGSGRADIGAHFLPFDTANFAFSSNTALTESAQQSEIYKMNQIVATASGATSAAQELVSGWYASGTTKVDKTWVPRGWLDTPNNIAFYQNVYARHCRTCHVNMQDAFPQASAQASLFAADTVCGGYWGRWRSHTMPNSMVTFNRFWTAGGSGIDQITPMENWQRFGSLGSNASNCYLTTTP